MARSLGRALETVLAKSGPGEDLEVEGPSLANARRRQLFRYLCLRPCARVGEIGRVVGSIDSMMDAMDHLPLRGFPMFQTGAPYFFDWLAHPY